MRLALRWRVGVISAPSMIKTKRPISHFIDDNGQACVLVPLANNKGKAIVYADRYAELAAQGLSLNWFLNANGSGSAYVKVRHPNGDNRVVARIVAGAPYCREIRYRNRNPLDLRCNNLIVAEGGRAYKDCSTLPAPASTEGELEAME